MSRDEGDLSADCSDFARLSRDSIHTARHDTDRTVLSCLASGVKWALETTDVKKRFYVFFILVTFFYVFKRFLLATFRVASRLS